MPNPTGTEYGLNAAETRRFKRCPLPNGERSAASAASPLERLVRLGQKWAMKVGRGAEAMRRRGRWSPNDGEDVDEHDAGLKPDSGE